MKNGELLRNISPSYGPQYDHLMSSGLYRELTERGLLIPHVEIAVTLPPGETDESVVYRTIRPQRIPFISYPYEWSFSQLQDAALATMNIQLRAMDYGMILKDASAYNIQFLEGNPLLIDTLSFDWLEAGQPWVAYQQFCKHFLAPLVLMSRLDSRMGQLSRNFIDGIPLDLASSLLPARTWLRPWLAMHLHFHARMQQKYSKTDAVSARGKNKKASLSQAGLQGIIQHLRGGVEGLRRRREATEWADYYSDTNYTKKGLEHKRQVVETFIDKVQPAMTWDMGANNGFFSHIAADAGSMVVAIDGDHEAVEYNYRNGREKNNSRIHPALVDLSNPSPGIGWHNRERMTLLERGPADLVMALALIHHLAISNNTPFELISRFFADCGRHLIIEFVPKSDSQVQRLLSGRKDMFDSYTREDFENAFEKDFTQVGSIPIEDSERIMYLFKRRE